MNVNKASNELGSQKKNSYKILISIKVIIYVTYHLEESFGILKWNFYYFLIFSCAL